MGTNQSTMIRSMLWVSGIYFFASLMVIPIIPLYAKSIGASTLQVGLITASFGIVPTILTIPAGSLVDRFGTVRPLRVGAGLILLAMLVLPIGRSLISLTVGLTLMGLGELLIVLCGQILVVAAPNEQEQGRNLASYTAVTSSGMALGPVVSGPVAHYFGYGAVFAVSIGCVVVMTALTLPGGSGPARSPSSSAALVDWRQVAALARHGGVQMGMLTGFGTVFLLAAHQTFVPLFMQELGYTTTIIGIVVGLRAAVGILIRYLMPWLIRLSGGTVRLLAWTFGVGLFGIALFAGVSSLPLILLATLAVGIGTGLPQPLSILLVAVRTAASIRGKAMAVRLTANRFAGLASPLFYGTVMGLAGTRAGFIGGGLVLSATLAGLLYVNHESEREHGPDWHRADYKA